jgi:DNA-nicking Smr family endonuclease
VKRLTHRNQRLPRAAKGRSALAVRSTRTPIFTVSQADGWLEGYRSELGPSALRRLRVAPGATLDLHGTTVEAAPPLLSRFLADERARGRKVVLVIVGKGHHSPGGRGALRAELADWLTTAPIAAHVLAFATALPQWGGSGGVLVLLAGPP